MIGGIGCFDVTGKVRLIWNGDRTYSDAAFEVESFRRIEFRSRHMLDVENQPANEIHVHFFRKSA